jgi:hypothetical protein
MRICAWEAEDDIDEQRTIVSARPSRKCVSERQEGNGSGEQRNLPKEKGQERIPAPEAAEFLELLAASPLTLTPRGACYARGTAPVWP